MLANNWLHWIRAKKRPSPVSQGASAKPTAKPPVAAAPLPKPPATRFWTDASGTRQVEATFIKLEAGRVFLRREDGKEVAVPLDALSRDDQEIVERLAAP